MVYARHSPTLYVLTFLKTTANYKLLRLTTFIYGQIRSSCTVIYGNTVICDLAIRLKFGRVSSKSTWNWCTLTTFSHHNPHAFNVRLGILAVKSALTNKIYYIYRFKYFTKKSEKLKSYGWIGEKHVVQCLRTILAI